MDKLKTYKDIGGYNQMKFLSNKYDDNHKFIFVHIPKNGGVSIQKMLNLGGGIFSIRDFSEKLNINDYFKFSIVRNPFDRLVSAYTYLKSGKQPVDRPYYDIVIQYPTLNDFIKNYLAKGDNLYKIPHFTLQNLWLKINGENKMDYVGKLEEYNKSAKEIFSHLNINKDNIIHTNKSNRGNYINYFDKETIEIVYNLYKEDFKEFNYEF